MVWVTVITVLTTEMTPIKRIQEDEPWGLTEAIRKPNWMETRHHHKIAIVIIILWDQITAWGMYQFIYKRTICVFDVVIYVI